MSAASIEEMHLLHAKVAEVLTNALQGDEPDPKILAAAITFLKNNSITAKSNDLDELTKLAEELTRKRVAAAASSRSLEHAATEFNTKLQ